MAPNFNLNKIIVAQRAEAEEIIEVLRKLINTNKLVTVNQFFDLVYIVGGRDADEWGWTDLRTASASETTDYWYQFNLPPVKRLK